MLNPTLKFCHKFLRFSKLISWLQSAQSANFLSPKWNFRGKIGPDESKIATIKNWPTPTTVKQVQSFLGLCNFYRNFIDHHSTKALGLLNYVKRKDRKWTPCAEETFQALKTALTSEPVIINPDFTNGQSLRLVSDASKTCLGYVLELIDAGGAVLGVVGYGSKKLQAAELNYPVREKELLAIIEGIKTFKHLLHRKQFTIHTDHESLKYWKRSTRELTGRLNNWLDFLADYDFSITYIKGETNAAADALSRIDSEGEDFGSPAESDVAVDVAELMLLEEILVSSLDLMEDITADYAIDPRFGVHLRTQNYQCQRRSTITSSITGWTTSNSQHSCCLQPSLELKRITD